MVATDAPDSYRRWRLSKRGCSEIARRWPKLQIDFLESATDSYRLNQAICDGRSEAKWAEQIQRLARTSQAFLAELEQSSWLVPSFRQVQFGKRQVWLHEFVAKAVRPFARVAAGYVEGMRNADRRSVQGPRAQFILTIRRQLADAGYGTSARPNDDLVRVLDILFENAGYPVADVRKTVAHALRKAGIEASD